MVSGEGLDWGVFQQNKFVIRLTIGDRDGAAFFKTDAAGGKPAVGRRIDWGAVGVRSPGCPVNRALDHHPEHPVLGTVTETGSPRLASG